MFSLLITIMAQSGPPDTAEQSGPTEAWWELLCTGVPTSPSPGTGPVSLRPITMLDPCWDAGGRCWLSPLPWLNLGPRPHFQQTARIRQLYGEEPGMSDNLLNTNYRTNRHHMGRLGP